MNSLVTVQGYRKYLTADERQRFVVALSDFTQVERLFCQTLLYTGCRLSEALAIKHHHFLTAEQCVLIRSLKKRQSVVHRRVPLPTCILHELAQAGLRSDTLFCFGRTTAWMMIKQVMLTADISGPQASPRGLRHTFGVHAIQQGVPLNLVQRWLGHARMETTAIYADFIGLEEIEMARRMW